jgi:hypothetical protein
VGAEKYFDIVQPTILVVVYCMKAEMMKPVAFFIVMDDVAKAI